jgi:hypothetical protein
MSHLHGRRRLAGSLAAFLVCVVLAACGTPETTAPPTLTATASAAPTTVAVTSPSDAPPATAAPSTADVTWTLVDLPVVAAGVHAITDVVELPGTVVATSIGDAAGGRGLAWTTSDGGATWASEPLPGTAQAIGRSIAWGDRVLTLGEGDGDCAHPSVTKIWIRDAAGGWKAAPFDPILCAGGIAQAAAAGEHAVILGTGAGDVGFAWSSDDGLTWTDRSKPFEGRLPQGVAADGSGFIAFGVGPGPAWSARSADGSAWDEPVTLPGLAGGAIIGNPVVLGDEVVVFVGDPSGAIGVLKPDGNGGWKSELTNGLTRETLARIVAVGDGLVALGGGETGPAAWISADGVSWRPLELPVEATDSGVDGALSGAAIVDGRAYLVGQIRGEGGAAGGATGALWSGPAALLQP